MFLRYIVSSFPSTSGVPFNPESRILRLALVALYHLPHKLREVNSIRCLVLVLLRKIAKSICCPIIVAPYNTNTHIIIKYLIIINAIINK